MLAFQSARRNNIQKHFDEIDHCLITNAKFFLNEKYYPSDNINVEINKKRFPVLYNMYTRFQKSY